MDFLSHILWTNLVFKEAPPSQRLLAVAFGVLPDPLAFLWALTPPVVKSMIAFKKPSQSLYRPFIFIIYRITHSLVIWTAVFLILWFCGFKWLAIAYCGWGFHILLDIFTHTKDVFPTRIFWPVSDFHFSGILWSNKWFLLCNYLVLLLMYLIFYIR